MQRVEPLSRAPGNLGEFIDEIGEGLSELYGPDAATHYQLVAPQAIRASLTHPSVTAVGAARTAAALANREETRTCDGLAVAVNRSKVAQVTLIHVLRGALERGSGPALIRGLVEQLRSKDVEGIICEAIPMAPLDLDGPFLSLGFRRIPRLLMIADLRAEGIARPTLKESRPLVREEVEALADVIVEAYRDHPGRDLHVEVRSHEGAVAFLESAMVGAFGTTRAAFTRVVQRDGRIVAGLVGSEIAPGVGFVLQVVVEPPYQNRGLGAVLLREVAQCFCEAGFRQIALGVTVGNPARRLYERLGFRQQRAVNAYVWWRSQR